MPVDAIGGTFNAQDTNALSNNNINQEQFIRLFLTQLRFQDPMEPVDNREFLSQLAQFTALEQSRQTSQNTTDLLSMNSSGQAVSLLNRQVEVAGLGAPFSGRVIAVSFTQNGPQLSVQDNVQTQTGIRLSQITLIRP
ncbi:MAG: flagellar hook capping protein [Lysobacteraceae bacterium]|nr:MAG: flagellar hook capping protein [Xanthomonadaceae bacterium]